MKIYNEEISEGGFVFPKGNLYVSLCKGVDLCYQESYINKEGEIGELIILKIGA